ncbi:hypothetical protein TEK04_15860 [Klenkia sp. LSe6-5]|uniref:Prealbumin-like fold domain-containing protein n=1 Tax=Klenkia sesuvii TaxID=3103137 RepID=A0ABU8DWH7_9ACTN
MALSRPRTTRRVLRGSALGLGLLVAGGVAAPAALAMEDPTVDPAAGTPEELSPAPAPLQAVPAAADGHEYAAPLSGGFGTGKDFEVQVGAHGPVPRDLDLSGAVFRATPTPSTGVLYECTTGTQGACSFRSTSGGYPRFATAVQSNAFLPAGDYVLTQVSASAGLARNPGSATFTVCTSPGCGPWGGTTVPVGVDSLFRTSLVTTVTDSATGAPVACAGFELSGPDYPHDDVRAPEVTSGGEVPAECAPAAPPAPETTAPETTAPETTAPETSTPETSTPTTTPADESSPSSSAPATDDATSTDPEAVVPLGFARGDDVALGSGVSDAAGRITFTGFFLPAEGYLLTPTTMPAGYTPDPAGAFGVVTTPQEAAARTPAGVARTVTNPLAAGSAPPTTTPDVAGAAPSGPPSDSPAPAAPATPSAASPATTGAALAATGSPVVPMLLVGTGLVALGGGALAMGTLARRRAHQRV